MKTFLCGAVCLLLWSYLGLDGAVAQPKADSPEPEVIKVITTKFVLAAKFEKLKTIATQQGFRLEHVYVEDMKDARSVIKNAAFVVLDTPRPNDLAAVQAAVGEALSSLSVPWIRVGGGPPDFRNLSPSQARQLIGYYASGGLSNFQLMIAYIAALRRGGDVGAIPPPSRLPILGIYHPAAPAPFASAEDYLKWGARRWDERAPRIAIAIHAGLVSGMETAVLDAYIAQSEAKGMVPIVFWFDAADSEGLKKVLVPAKADVLISATHLQNGPARRVEFEQMGIPVLQAVGFRDGDITMWIQAKSGMSQFMVAPFLSVPETWGVSDPVVTEAVRNGEPVPILPQIDALLEKARRLAVLRHKKAQQKRITVMFWNYPPGEKNFSASNLNVPKSIAALSVALATAGYDVTQIEENALIRAAQRMLGAIYHPDTIEELFPVRLAVTVPVRRYREWLNTLSEERKAELISRWGEPEQSPFVRNIAGEKQFIIPRLRAGNMEILPQPPRSGAAGANYHDTSVPPDHMYLATYLYVRELSGTDALIHFGTHGTQEWTPGKDRGLAVTDYPFLTVGSTPVFYPYIQDNVGEALQAKRRGRAVSISHQTPPFAPAGLYNELNDLHTLIHEYLSLEEGAVRDRTATLIRDRVLGSDLYKDLGWGAEKIDKDFSGFLGALHDHLHELAKHAMPLGLHTFGVSASPEHRLTTVMQQLGEPFYKRLRGLPAEFFARDQLLQSESEPYRFLHRFLREAASLDQLDADLRALVEKAIKYDRTLAETNELEALLSALSGNFVRPGAGGDPIRNPEIVAGRDLYGFEPDKIPTKAAYETGEQALQKLLDAYRLESNGKAPEKLAFSLWSSETMRHLGVVESQLLHALGLRPVWNNAGRLLKLDIISQSELKRPRIDVVLHVTSVYRDQFDGFMRLLAEAIDRLSLLDEENNPVFKNTRTIAEKLIAQGFDPAKAQALAALRIFSGEPGDYGTGLPERVLKSASWGSDSSLAETFLKRQQYAYGKQEWGVAVSGQNLLEHQLRGTNAAILSRSSTLHGVLSTDHPFELLGGLSLAVRHLDGKSPSLFVSDLRSANLRISQARQFLATEMRARYLNPSWISAMKQEGYAGTLEMLNIVNNFWGWQVVDPSMVRADQWQAIHDTFVRDIRNLDLAKWFEQYNPTAQAQILERMVEAIRKNYWSPNEETKREIIARLQDLEAKHKVRIDEVVTREFIAKLAAGFGVAQIAPNPGPPAQQSPHMIQPVKGPVLERSEVPTDPWASLRKWLALGALLACMLAGGFMRHRSNAAAA